MLPWTFVHVPFGVHVDTCLLGINPEVELLEHKVWGYSVLVNIAKELYKSTRSAAMIENSSCPTSLPTLGIVCLLNFDHFGLCIVLSSCGLGLYSPDTSWCKHFFMCFLNICIFFSWHNCSHVLSTVGLYFPYWLVGVSKSLWTMSYRYLTVFSDLHFHFVGISLDK